MTPNQEQHNKLLRSLEECPEPIEVGDGMTEEDIDKEREKMRKGPELLSAADSAVYWEERCNAALVERNQLAAKIGQMADHERTMISDEKLPKVKDVKKACKEGVQKCHECDDLSCHDNLVVRLREQRIYYLRQELLKARGENKRMEKEVEDWQKKAEDLLAQIRYQKEYGAQKDEHYVVPAP